MSALNPRRATIIGVSGLSLAVAGAIAPGAFAAESVDGDVTISNTETVQVQMDASGKVDAQRVYEQLVLRGKGSVDVSNPVSTDGLRNLDGFGGFDVRDGKVRVKTGVDGTKKYRSVSTFTKKLPITVKATYLLDGKQIAPSDVVGKSGALEVRYVVTNTTETTEDVTFENGSGSEVSESTDVVVPMVASMTTVLPSSFTKVETQGANAAGDGRGGTQLSFTMTLIPPIGSATAEIGYKAQVKDAVVPPASISALPVDPLQNTSFATAAAGYSGGAQTGQDLTAGATEIDANVLKLRDGASDLVNGIIQLRDGADQLSAGLQNEAAPGAKKLADGADELDAGAEKLSGGAGQLSDGTEKLSAGAKKLNKGAGDLSDGLKTAAAGGPALLEGVTKLKDGAVLLNKGLTTLNESVVPGANQISGGATQLINALDAQLIAGLNGATQYIDGADQAANGLPDSPEKTVIIEALGNAKSLVDQVKTGLDTTVRGGLTGIKGGADKISAGVDGTTKESAAGTVGTLRNGVAQLIGGLTQLQTKGGELSDGLKKLNAGAGQLSAGAGDLSKGAGDLDAGADQLDAGAGTLKGGTGQLSDGASDLSDGLATAAAGSGELAAGLGTAAESAPALPDGAERLSKEGTSQLVQRGDATASDFGKRYALLEAGAKRAATAQPYGSPVGATALTAYKYEIAGEDGADSANLTRGVAAVVVLGMAGLVAALRRRGII